MATKRVRGEAISASPPEYQTDQAQNEALTGPHEGTIRKLDLAKGFGFIRADNGKDYFFHMSGVEGDYGFNDLQLGNVVSFEGAITIKGCRATAVRLVRETY
jgi:cold shock protein